MMATIEVTGTWDELTQALMNVQAGIDAQDGRVAIEGEGGEVVFKIVSEGSDEDFGSLRIEVV